MLEWLRRLRAERRQPSAENAGAPSPPPLELLIARSRERLAEGAFADALAIAEAAIDAYPAAAAAHCAAGAAALALGRAEEAVDAFQIALHYRGDDPESIRQLGQAYSALDQPEAAMRELERAVEVASGSVEAWRSLGLEHLKRGRYEAAEHALRRAHAILPSNRVLLNDLGYVLGWARGRHAEALELFARALAVNPDQPDVLLNRGLVQQHLGEFPAAQADYERALALKPDLAEARLNLGLIHLLAGDFARGWDHYEARHRVLGAQPGRKFELPAWEGEEVRDGALLIYGEQGLGDEIMFASCIPDAMRRTRTVILNCAPKLAGLMRRSFPDAIVHAGGQAEADKGWLATLPSPRAVSGIGSLPRFFRRHAQDFPVHGGYLHADPVRVSRWRERLAALGPGLKVGLSWRGGTARTRGDIRSIDLPALAPILRAPGVHCVSLQYGDVGPDLSCLDPELATRLAHFPEAIADYEETAALVCALDRVVSVCTAVIHLAGALGRPTWVLVPAVPEWRYLRQGTSLPWYPAVELLRQASVKRWDEVIDVAAGRLREVTQRVTV